MMTVGVAAVLLAIARAVRVWRKRVAADLGSVSGSWLVEHRAGRER
jgi:hypothetical protein